MYAHGERSWRRDSSESTATFTNYMGTTMDNNGKVHTKTEGFHDAEDAERKKLEDELKVQMRTHLAMATKELDDGVLHGLVIVRVNEQHKVAGSIALCNMAANEVAMKMQEISMDLVMADAPPRIRGLLDLLRSLEGRKPS
jgi:hypothetical protein